MTGAHENPFDPSQRTLRQFAILWLIFFSGMAAWQGLYHGRTRLAIAIAIAAVVIGPLGFWKPALIRPIFVGWMRVARPIGIVVSSVLLTLLFYVLFTPVAMVFRLIGRDELALKRPMGGQSYWSAKPHASKAQYFQQF
jgi:hypothetical protein